LLAFTGCDLFGEDATIELDEGEVRLEGGARVHDVAVRGAGGRDALEPGEVSAASGDAVRFVVEDRRPHALAFDADSLSAEARTFLEEGGQLRGPPLVDEGAAWVVSLEGAPAGRYPFVCRSHGARGVLMVREED
ncbi:MAG TPA: plastocyanin/azurin family copper-binding protein, partial [Longimicrobiales bacterium]|nr:plastocyanin/azurin family copper-binding protein [Longimicrobiales bacterium]